MARSINVLSDTYPCASAAAIVARRVVVMDSATRGNVKLPAVTTPEKTAVGVTLEKQSAANNVSVQIAGIAVVESDGSAVINPGDYVIVEAAAGNGRVKTQALAAGSAATYNVIGMCVSKAQVPATAGALAEIRLNPHIATAA